MFEDFEGFKKVKAESLEEQAGRPKLVEYTVKQNHVKWTVKNSETGKIYYIKIDEENPVDVLHAFLSSVRAYDTEKRIKTEQPVDYKEMAEKIVDKGIMKIWIPVNRENIIKKVWNINSYMTQKESKDLVSFKEYIKK